MLSSRNLEPVLISFPHFFFFFHRECGACTFINQPSATKCGVCDGPRPAIVATASRSGGGGGGAAAAKKDWAVRARHMSYHSPI